MKTYDPKQVLISLGAHIVTGYANGTYVTIEPNGDGITKNVGADGEIVRSIDPDKSAKVKLSLLQTSPTVAFAQAQFDLDYATGEGTFPILVKDMKGGLIFSSEDAWVVKPPSREFAKSDSDRTVEIDTGTATYEGEG